MHVDPDNLILARALNQVSYCPRRPAAPNARPTRATRGAGAREDVRKMRMVSTELPAGAREDVRKMRMVSTELPWCPPELPKGSAIPNIG